MKKVVLALAVVFSVALVSCSSEKKAEDTVKADSIENVDSPAVDTPAADSPAVDTPAADSVKA